MTDDLSVVMISNRGPVSFATRGGELEMKRGAGGLAGALDPVARRLGERAVWIAAATSDDDRRALSEGVTEDLVAELGYRLHLLDIDPDVYSQYYDDVSNRMLWFANHCLWDEIGIERFGDEELKAWSNAYKPVNERFARGALDAADAESLVLVQDYHLTLVPSYIKRERPDQTILHFTHSSFCGPEGLERLPAPIPREVIEGMLGADLVGLHVAPWVHGFLDACEAIDARVDRDAGAVEHNGHRSWVREYPIPIDVDDMRARADSEEARRWAARFERDTSGPLIVRADRAEPSKNIVRGFEAFGALLDRRDDLRGKARFIACVYPSRQSMEEYRRYAQAIEAAVQGVNERHPGSIELFLEDDFDRTLGALSVYDVLLVNPIMDGMNLVSKEGPTVNGRDGVLVLSRGAGSFEELGDSAVRIDDSLDVHATADALERALEMDGDERKRLSRALRERAAARKPGHWIEAQLADLQAVQAGAEPESPPS
ncbi:MAG TPA: trehalose-6-phosphate synthase [Actinomycetota bacterium]|nr:trehalose-6-phosphate synthase [Actinomycetota bacterium]